MVTLTVVGAMMSGLATDAITVKLSPSSTRVSPSIVTCWHIELRNGVVPLKEPETNREINI